MNADRITITTSACLLYLIMNSGVNIPIFVKKKANIGNSNITPQAKHTPETVLMYYMMLRSVWKAAKENNIQIKHLL